MKKLLIAMLGPSYGTTLIGVGEAAGVGALTFALNTEYHNPRVFWSGMGLAVLAAVRGRITKQVGVSNAPNPLPVAQEVIPISATKPTVIETK